jgi:hypothetical protein
MKSTNLGFPSSSTLGNEGMGCGFLPGMGLRLPFACTLNGPTVFLLRSSSPRSLKLLLLL